MSELLAIPALDEDELETLGLMLEEEAEKQDSLDFFEVHGLLTAWKTGPVDASIDQIKDIIFDQTPSFDADKQKTFDQLLIKLANEIQAWLDSGHDFPVPCDLSLEASISEDDDEDVSPIELWGSGFMTAVIMWEDQWYAKEEEQVANFLFPIMYASGLFAEEPEMEEIDDNIEMSNQMCANIPAAIIELFLHFHSAKG